MEHPPPIPSTERVRKWLKYGLVFGIIGVLFFGIIFGPVAIYFGVRASTAANALNAREHGTKAALIIALGAFDILFFLIMAVGTIRLIGAGG